MFIVAPYRVSLSIVLFGIRLLFVIYLQYRLYCIISQLGIYPCFPRSITRNNQLLHLNIYTVCSLRTLLALALIYISLLPMYENMSILPNLIVLYCILNMHYKEYARYLHICAICTRFIITICNCNCCHSRNAFRINYTAKIGRILLHTKQKKLTNLNEMLRNLNDTERATIIRI